MFRNKRYAGISLLVCMCCLGCGCSLNDSLFSDTGSRIETTREKTDYLDLSVLESTEEATQTYETAVLNYGTFTTSAMAATYNRGFYVTSPVRAKVERGTMTYVSTLVANYQQVEKGTEIAKVEIKVDPVDIQEAQTKLTRLRERYQRAKNEYVAQRNADIVKNNAITDAYEKRAGEVLLERSALEWENTCRDYEQQIREMSETVTELRNAASTTTIVADKSGNIILPKTPYKNGDTIEDGDVICGIISLDDLYFVAGNEKMDFRYGMEFDWNITQFKDSLKGKMVNATSADLYGNLDTSSAYFQVSLPEEADSKRITNAKISGNLKTMEHVLLVPAKAVTVEEDKTYVTVVGDDGALLKTGFVAGGANSEYYWVLSGLKEGTTVLVKQ